MIYRLTVLGFFAFFLTACALFQGTPRSNHEAICNELKHKMIWSGATDRGPELWNGATGDPLHSTQQRAQNETLIRNYHEQGCDEGFVDDGTR